LADFIETNGGIGGISRPRTESTITDVKKAELALEIIADRNLAVADGEVLGQSFEGDDLDRPCVLIATPQDDGSFVINAVVKTKAALNAALIGFYGVHKAEVKKAEEEQKESAKRKSQKSARNNIVRESQGAHYAM